MKLVKILISALLVLSFSASTLSADAGKGQRIFIKKFKKQCGFAGDKFAAKHSQDEWQKIYDAGEFKNEMIKICPKVQESSIKDKWVKDLFDFSYKYANDSGEVPSC